MICDLRTFRCQYEGCREAAHRPPFCDTHKPCRSCGSQMGEPPLPGVRVWKDYVACCGFEQAHPPCMVERCRLRVCVPGNPTCWRHHEQGTGQEFYCRQTPYVSMRESFAEQLRKFKRKVQQEAIIKEIKKHTVYLKPGEKRRLKQAMAKKRIRKKLRRDISEL